MTMTSGPPARRTTPRARGKLGGILGGVLALVLAGCSTGGASEEDRGDKSASTKEVVLVTHDSWAMPDEVLAAFTKETGYTVKVQPAGDAGSLTNRLVLTKNSPIGDAAYGIDNTFASRAVDEEVFAEHSPADQPASVDDHALEGEGGDRLTPVDVADVCVNVDDTWFARKKIAPPKTLDDLVDPTYKDLLVAPGATTSSPGLAFLLATVAEYGESGWPDYWRRLMDNGVKLTSGWTDAYTVDFTAGGGDGDRPIVVSYASSPPFTVSEETKRPTTSALLDTCFRQVEYAGVIEGAENEEGARALVDFMVSDTFQEALPTNMYVFPVSDQVELPEDWEQWAKTAEDPYEVGPGTIAENRDGWLRTWGDITSR